MESQEVNQLKGKEKPAKIQDNLTLDMKVDLLKAHVEYLGALHELELHVHYEFPYFMINTANFRLKVTLNVYDLKFHTNEFSYDVNLHFDPTTRDMKKKYAFLAELDKVIRGY